MYLSIDLTQMLEKELTMKKTVHWLLIFLILCFFFFFDKIQVL